MIYRFTPAGSSTRLHALHSLSSLTFKARESGMTWSVNAPCYLTVRMRNKQANRKPIIKILRLWGLSWLLCVLSCPCAWGITVTNEAKPMCSYCWLKTKSKTPWCWLCLHPIFDSLQKAHLSEFQKCVRSVKCRNSVLLCSRLLCSSIFFFSNKQKVTICDFLFECNGSC